MDTNTLPSANHHRDLPGFSGLSGLLAAITFLRGRDEVADLAQRLAEVGSGSRLVDIGCGPGAAARAAGRRGATVMGIDPAPVMLRVARMLRSPNVTWRSGTAEELPVESGWATAVWSLATVHHWNDLDRGLDEVCRVLGPGGVFVAIEREIEANATGLGSHGWQAVQAESFALDCKRKGFVEVKVERFPIKQGQALCVVARAAGVRTPR